MGPDLLRNTTRTYECYKILAIVCRSRTLGASDVMIEPILTSPGILWANDVGMHPAVNGRALFQKEVTDNGPGCADFVALKQGQHSWDNGFPLHEALRRKNVTSFIGGAPYQ